MGTDWHRRLGAMANGLDRRGFALTIAPERAPDEPTRQALSERHTALTGSLSHRDDDAVRREIAAMIATYRIGRYSTEDARFTVTSYTRSLSDLPAWAVIETVRAFGRNHSGDHPPTAGQLHRAAEERCRLAREERQKIADVLTARIEAPAERPELDDLKARHGDNWGLVEDPEEAAKAARRAAAMHRARERDEKRRRDALASAGIDPATTPCSLALLKSPLVRKEQENAR